MRNAHVLYTIGWQKQDSIILPVHMTGKSQFIGASKNSSSKTGESIVEWMFDKRGVIDAGVLDDMLAADPRVFPRKGAALLSNVWSILFLNQTDGLLELGFEQPHEAREALSYLVPKKKDKMQDQECLAELFPHASMASDLAGDVSLCSPAASSQELGCIQPLSPSKPLEEVRLSAGSAGHPHCCGLPCKYAGKKKGCKEGAECTRCHLCRFVAVDRRRWRGGVHKAQSRTSKSGCL